MLEATTQAWLDAMDVATQCLHLPTAHRVPRESTPATTQAGIAYLQALEQYLTLQPIETWQGSPPDGPSAFDPQSSVTSIGFSPTTDPDTLLLLPSQVSLPQSVQPNSTLLANPFASIALSDDEDDDNDEGEDYVVLQPSHKNDNEAALNTRDPTCMSILRLLIRIYSSISDLWAHQGHTLATQNEWMSGAAALQQAIQRIHQALNLADRQISRYYEEKERDGRSTANITVLQDDASIVHVAITSLVQARDRYVAQAKRRVQRLKRILQPQWKARDQAKQRMGQERWRNNPEPKHDFSKLREDSEQELEQLQQALDALSLPHWESLEGSADLLQSRVSASGQQRYNGKRPEAWTHEIPVVRLPGYPDATEYGWTFTGSYAPSRVEFFERVLEESKIKVKLDFYYTTGTVKTSLEHPKRGKTQLFASSEQITPDLYVQILEHPRAHTRNLRYRRKQDKPKGSSKSRQGQRRRRTRGGPPTSRQPISV